MGKLFNGISVEYFQVSASAAEAVRVRRGGFTVQLFIYLIVLLNLLMCGCASFHAHT